MGYWCGEKNVTDKDGTEVGCRTWKNKCNTSISYEQSRRRIDTHNKSLIMWNTTRNTPSTIEVQMLARWLRDSPLFCCLRCDKLKDTKMPQAALEQPRQGWKKQSTKNGFRTLPHQHSWTGSWYKNTQEATKEMQANTTSGAMTWAQQAVRIPNHGGMTGRTMPQKTIAQRASADRCEIKRERRSAKVASWTKQTQSITCLNTCKPLFI